MTALVHSRCLNHGQREAVARCPLCTSYFCRECIVEHGGRVLCAPCLSKSALTAGKGRSRWGAVLFPPGAFFGFCLAWLFFLAVGKSLIRIPAAIHEGSWFESLGEQLE